MNSHTMAARFRRPVAGVLAAALVTSGCAGGLSRLDKEDLVAPEPAKSYRVTTRTGDRLLFIALHLEGEWLVGTVRRTSSTVVGEGETQRSNVTNRYEEVRIPWDTVALVEAEGGRGAPSGVLLAGGAIVVGALAFLLFSGVGGSDDSGGGGKGF